ncbi:hypothetical protein N656DRAFT_267455 [Canariomyces notabilis]|uniref:Uncharacterized protein n=1 Tax=Canariomyces notabilis TaxID=2074819 RepID=A0AAN6TLK1_9PEZI|nr:hypothetical protein N656DRAFT_267455 [Canariomyces arenarius]
MWDALVVSAVSQFVIEVGQAGTENGYVSYKLRSPRLLVSPTVLNLTPCRPFWMSLSYESNSGRTVNYSNCAVELWKSRLERRDTNILVTGLISVRTSPYSKNIMLEGLVRLV